MVEYIFNIQHWEDKGDKYYFAIRKMAKQEADAIKQLKTFWDLFREQEKMKHRKLFIVEYKKDTREITGYFHSMNNEQDTRELKPEEKTEMEKEIRIFEMKNKFQIQPGESGDVMHAFFEVKNFLTQLTEFIKQQTEFIREHLDLLDEEEFFSQLEDEMTKENTPRNIQDKVIFELRKAWLFTPTGEPP